jgi:hypothetical protein
MNNERHPHNVFLFATSEDQSILSFYPPHTAMLQQLNEVFSLDMAEHEKILAQEWKEFCDKVNLKMFSIFSVNDQNPACNWVIFILKTVFSPVLSICFVIAFCSRSLDTALLAKVFPTTFCVASQ